MIPCVVVKCATGCSSDADSSLSERFRKVSSWAKQFQGKVPGSRLTTPEDVEFVRNSLHCLAHKGRWVFNPNPRPIPWHYEGLDICDKRCVLEGTNVRLSSS